MRYNRNEDYFTMWYEDKKSITLTMYRNMQADLECGYNPFGDCIRRQREDIARYEAEIDHSLETFKTMTEEQINHWCFYDLLYRGAIA